MNHEPDPMMSASDADGRLDQLDVSAAEPLDRPVHSESHPFDPISAVLGVIASCAGALVVTGTVDPLGADDAGVWLAGAVIAIGVILLPWGGRRAS